MKSSDQERCERVSTPPTHALHSIRASTTDILARQQLATRQKVILFRKSHVYQCGDQERICDWLCGSDKSRAVREDSLQSPSIPTGLSLLMQMGRLLSSLTNGFHRCKICCYFGRHSCVNGFGDGWWCHDGRSTHHFAFVQLIP